MTSRKPKAQSTITGNPYELYIAWRWFLVGNTVLNIPAANIVINALGIHDVEPNPQTSRIEIAPGDGLLLCSDGLYKNLTEAEIIEGLAHGEAGADDLGEAAFARSNQKTTAAAPTTTFRLLSPCGEQIRLRVSE